METLLRFSVCLCKIFGLNFLIHKNLIVIPWSNINIPWKVARYCWKLGNGARYVIESRSGRVEEAGKTVRPCLGGQIGYNHTKFRISRGPREDGPTSAAAGNLCPHAGRPARTRTHTHTRTRTRVCARVCDAHARMYAGKKWRWYTVGRHVNSFETHGRAQRGVSLVHKGFQKRNLWRERAWERARGKTNDNFDFNFACFPFVPMFRPYNVVALESRINSQIAFAFSEHFR